MKQQPKVSVCMITYSHENFIAQAIDGVLMQDCDFEVELIIANDCSQDSTDDVVKNILDNHPRASWINYIKHDKNLGMMPNFIFALQQCQGEYIALCEGDDYWTEPLKLQKQVDFLEANLDYSICWTKYKILNTLHGNDNFEEPDWIDSIQSGINLEIDLNTIFTPYFTYILTCMFRRESFDLEICKKLKHSKDNTLYAMCLTKGNGMLLNFYSAVYRIHDGSVYSSATNFNQKYFSYLNLKEIVAKIPGCKNANLKNIRNQLLIQSFLYCPNQKSQGYLKLILDSLNLLGIKKTLRLIIKKYKSDSL